MQGIERFYEVIAGLSEDYNCSKSLFIFKIHRGYYCFIEVIYYIYSGFS